MATWPFFPFVLAVLCLNTPVKFNSCYWFWLSYLYLLMAWLVCILTHVFSSDVCVGLRLQQVLKSQWQSKVLDRSKPLKKFSVKHKLSSSREKHKFTSSLMAVRKYPPPIRITSKSELVSHLNLTQIQNRPIRTCAASKLDPVRTSVASKLDPVRTSVIKIVTSINIQWTEFKYKPKFSYRTTYTAIDISWLANIGRFKICQLINRFYFKPSSNPPLFLSRSGSL